MRLIQNLSVVILVFISGCSSAQEPVTQPKRITKLERLSVQIKRKPTDVRLLLERAELLEKNKDYTEAMKDYASVLKLEPKNEDAFFDQCFCLRRLERHQENIDMLSEFIEANPENVRALRNRAISYRNLKKYREAIVDCEKAISINPEYAPAYCSRAFIALDLGYPRKGLEYIDHAIKIDATEADYFDFRACLYCNLDLPEKALPEIERALEIEPTQIFALRRRAEIFAKSYRDFKKATLAFQELLSHHPNSKQDILNLARCHEAQKEFKLAAEAVSRAIEIDRKNFEVRWMRASYNMNAEKWPEAYEDLFYISKESRGKGYKFESEFTATLLSTEAKLTGEKQSKIENNVLRRAFEEINNSITSAPEDPELLLERAVKYVQWSRPLDAIEDLTSAIDLAPIESKYRFLRIEVYANFLDDQKEVLSDCEYLIQTDPRCAAAYFLKAESLGMLGHYEEAIGSLDLAIKNVKEFKMPFETAFDLEMSCYLLRGRFHIVQRNSTLAISDLRMAINLGAGNRADEILKNVLLAKKYKYLDLLRATLVTPSDTGAWSLLGVKKMDLAERVDPRNSGLRDRNRFGNGRRIRASAEVTLKSILKGARWDDWIYESAISDLSKAVFTDSENHIARYNRGLCHAMLKQTRDANRDFEYLARERGMAVDFSGLADAQFNLQRYSDALASYEKAKSLAMSNNSLDEAEISILNKNLALARTWAKRRRSSSNFGTTSSNSAESELQRARDFKREMNSRRGHFGPAHKVPDW